MTEPSPTVYTGLDISKAQLQLHLNGRQRLFDNNRPGRKRLTKLLLTSANVHLICEATGGYERDIVAALHQNNIKLSVLNPSQVRHFALAQGQRAKSDPIDAAVLTACGYALQPAPTPVADADLAELRQLVQWRQQLKEQLVRANQWTEHSVSTFIGRQQRTLAKQLNKQLEKVDKEIAVFVAEHPPLHSQVKQLTALDGVGDITAVGVLCHMPELGRLNRRETAALAGLAPWIRQSGPWQGQRHIGGGRAAVRRILYMSAVSLARRKHTTLGAFYTRLRQAGKPAKVALTAVMRKLLLDMNRTLKSFSPSAA